MTIDRTYRTIQSCEIEIPQPCALIIFGASGDLSKRKLMPALYRLFKNRLLPDNFFVCGIGRSELNTTQFRSAMQTAVKDTIPASFDQRVWDEFSLRLYFNQVDYEDQRAYIASIRDKLPELERKHQTLGNRIYYLAVPPPVFESVVRNLGSTGMTRDDTASYRHVVIEKPFGRDLDSAKKLNELVHEYFKENQIFRIDHYLAKETVQNILMLRFANSIFEPLWNRRYIDHIQITAAETLGVERRAGYYENAGVIRDMFQNHVFQLLALIAMESPVSFETDAVRDERARVLRAASPIPLDHMGDHVVVGQYDAGIIDGKPIAAYRDEPGISPRSTTPTYAAMKFYIDNWRWNGVPFYLRSGKRLKSHRTEIFVCFRPVPHSVFPETVAGPIEPNGLALNIHPEEGINILFQTKQPGSKICLNRAAMNFSYPKGVLLDAYEWVLVDCMLCDQMLFTREDAFVQAWSLLSPVIEKTESSLANGNIPLYTAGSSGPDAATKLIERDGRSWRDL